MKGDNAIVRPIIGRKSPRLGALAVMVSSGGDLERLCRMLEVSEHPARLMMSRLFLSETSEDCASRCAVAGPVVGAPYAVMLMEPLIAWGARKIIFMGWCGAISPHVNIGDLIVPAGAVIDEGTSPGYGALPMETSYPSESLNRNIKAALRARGEKFHEGLVWSTDAIYQETPEKVACFQSKKAIAVEMELSSLFTVGRFRGVEVGAVLAVSDELTTLSWKPGFRDERFSRSRKILLEVLEELCRNPL